MARYKEVNYAQQKFIPVDFASQIIPGSFEYTLDYLIENALDRSLFDGRYGNDDSGAPAFNPKVRLKILLFAYARGVTSSRKMEKACRENIVFLALSADTRPPFTTMADFISTMDKEMVTLFRDVFMVGDPMNRMGRERFAIEGCTWPSHASKEWSGTKEELLRKKKRIERAVRHMRCHHREEDRRNVAIDKERREKEQQAIQTMKKYVKKRKGWLDENDDRRGKSGKPKKSHVTDNESAKIKTSKGVIQGYDGLASVDSQRQIIVHAEAFGEAQEHDLLQPMMEGTQDNFGAMGKRDIKRKTRLTADSGFYNKNNLEYL